MATEIQLFYHLKHVFNSFSPSLNYSGQRFTKRILILAERWQLKNKCQTSVIIHTTWKSTLWPSAWENDPQPHKHWAKGQENDPQTHWDKGQEIDPQTHWDKGQEIDPQIHWDKGQENDPQTHWDKGQEIDPQTNWDKGQEIDPQTHWDKGQGIDPQTHWAKGQENYPQTQWDKGQENDPKPTSTGRKAKRMTPKPREWPPNPLGQRPREWPPNPLGQRPRHQVTGQTPAPWQITLWCLNHKLCVTWTASISFNSIKTSLQTNCPSSTRRLPSSKQNKTTPTVTEQTKASNLRLNTNYMSQNDVTTLDHQNDVTTLTIRMTWPL